MTDRSSGDVRLLLWGLAVLVLALLATACTGATVGSGVGDRLLRHPPYYAGARVTAAEPIGHLPIAYQRGATHAPIFDPSDDDGTAVAALLAEMNAYLDLLDASARIQPAAPPRGTPPDVRFGCQTDATGDCTGEGMGTDGEKPHMFLSVGRPSGEWTDWAASTLADAGLDRALLITLEVGQYWPRQKNWRGSKEVELGSGYAVDLPWLTSLETPVLVLQLTGALVGLDGKAIRIGAEGLLARRTNILLSGLGAQALISGEDVERLRTARRDDLPGRPLVWQAALGNLVSELTGQRGVAARR